MVYEALTSIFDVEAYYAMEFTQSSVPSVTQVAQWADEATAIIYGVIKDRYVIPVTDATDRLILKSISDLYVLEKINPILKSGTKKPIDTKVKYESIFEKKLNLLEKGCLTLINTSASSGSYMAYSYNEANSITPETTKETTQW